MCGGVFGEVRIENPVDYSFVETSGLEVVGESDEVIRPRYRDPTTEVDGLPRRPGLLGVGGRVGRAEIVEGVGAEMGGLGLLRLKLGSYSGVGNGVNVSRGSHHLTFLALFLSFPRGSPR